MITFIKFLILILLVLNTIILVRLFLKEHDVFKYTIDNFFDKTKYELIPNDEKLLFFKFLKFLFLESILIGFYIIINLQ
jgi:hypothetical protein